MTVSQYRTSVADYREEYTDERVLAGKQVLYV